ncbi:hypothetical protein QWY75_10995 [Pontixanthobacter aestiaquae]|uniref:Uncharacterized protein n=1 Tax=Pontixanthobacter aestiaquae TaxID=1509367 RepID=A0A844Z649_9SPHN|nr:hypothetical protein [Pontixanthobacter aestiaquae]MDN3646727.1 hypothetical protein [Pontixanthobacter aestiaquae]MXO82290.1 hypothetical protein [Pontixanthobacter aestiaquae]
MIDYFALALTHGLILLALIRIAGKAELDREPELDVDRGKRRQYRERHQGDAGVTGQSEHQSDGARDA